MGVPPIPAGQMTYRDWCAIHAMAQIIGNDDTRRAIIAESKQSGTDRYILLAQKAYQIADAMAEVRP